MRGTWNGRLYAAVRGRFGSRPIGWRRLGIIAGLMAGGITAERSAAANAFVRFDFNLTLQNRSRSTVFIEVFDDRPLTRDNFLQYVNGGHYDGLLMHRLARDFVLQGGGFYPQFMTEPAPVNTSLNPAARVDLDGNPATTNPMVANEFTNSPFRSNVRGTLAMAKQGGNPDSATSEFFFNINNNSANLDNQNGGFTVFAQVIGDGMSVIDAYNGLGITNLNPDFNDDGFRDAGWPFGNSSTDGVPFIGSNLLIANEVARIDYLGGGSVTTVPAGGLTFNARDVYIDTGAVINGTGALTIDAGRRMGIREGISLAQPLVNRGTLELGLQLGEVTLSSFRQDPGATLEIQLRLTDSTIPDNQEMDKLTVTGAALLGGTLDVSLLNGYQPTKGKTFTVLTAAAIVDTFDAINLPSLNAGLAWETNTTSTAVTLGVVAPDFNRNGIVDAADVTTLRTQFGQTGSNLLADGNGDGRVDGTDMLILQRHMGKNVGVLSVTAVPEPAGFAIALSAVAAFAMWRRRG
jgi:cyclophilin family peptidyl-prolyl cis-trans isomerase